MGKPRIRVEMTTEATIKEIIEALKKIGVSEISFTVL